MYRSATVPTVLVALAMTACGGGQKAEEPAPEAKVPKKWEGCEEIKERLVSETITFSEANYTGTAETWAFPFAGLDVRVPTGEYEVLPSVGPESVSLLLNSPEARVLLIADPPSEPIEDIFQQVGVEPTMEGRKRTQEMFGGAPTLHQLIVKGYQHLPSELTCEASRADEEVPIAAAMMIARVGGPGELLAIHHDRRSMGEIAFFRKKGDADDVWYEWEVWVPTDKYWYITNYHARDRDRVEAVAANGLIGAAEGQVPTWLELLSKAAAYPNDTAGWRALHEELSKQGASEKSLRKIAELAGMAPDAPPTDAPVREL